MTRRPRLSLGVWILALAASGCSDTARPPRSASTSIAEDPSGGNSAGPISDDVKRGILNNVLKLIRDAATNAGGDNFNIATENLNDYFLDAKPEDFALSEPMKQFLQSQKLPPDALPAITEPKFQKNDGRHIEDNLLYHELATRVAGEGDDLTRVRRVFEWVVRHAMLVPNGALAPPNLEQAQARPYDVLLRGMATEDRKGWSERGWLFLVLCRQLGLDAGMVVSAPSNRPLGPVLKSPLEQPPRRLGRPWACAVLIGGKVYLFEPGLGIPIPTADGKGVATLEQAATDPRVLGQLDLPGRNYEPTFADLAGPAIVLLESSLGTLSPRMKLLQHDLGGNNRMILYRDPVEQAEAFQTALGARCAGVELWMLPVTVEYRLFHAGPGDFVGATLYPLQFFVSKWPLLSARLTQLRGETAAAIQSYVVFRFSDHALESDGKTRIPVPVQNILDIFATYYLALAQMEKGDPTQAKFLFGKTLETLPEFGRDQPYFTMFRWGAATNLGMLYADSAGQAWKLYEQSVASKNQASEARYMGEAILDSALAIRYLCQETPTPQTHGNLLRARALIWQNPFAPPPGTPAVIPPPATGIQ
ncbi:MAG: hypothetical protein JWN86_4316 [Planctomycetota bacterium]|nr:hypothetical protein [Planctomycetota bacterium]